MISAPGQVYSMELLIEMEVKATSSGQAGFRNHLHSEKWEASKLVIKSKEEKKGGRGKLTILEVLIKLHIAMFSYSKHLARSFRISIMTQEWIKPLKSQVE